MQWLLLAFGIIRVCGTACMKLSDRGRGVGRLVLCIMAALGYNHIMRCNLYSRFVVSLLGCGGEMRGMKSLCAGYAFKSGV